MLLLCNNYLQKNVSKVVLNQTQILYMKHTFTPIDLVNFLYQELSSIEKIEISEAIQMDWSLQEAYEELSAAKAQLPAVKFSPSKKSIQAILEYSAKSEVNTI